MRQGQQNRRGRGRNNNNRKSQNPLTRSFESTGPDVKLRGTPSHIAEKYMSLARDAHSSGDPVLAENYMQHAEHYNRIIMSFREQQISQGGDPYVGTIARGPSMSGEPVDDDEFSGEEGEDYGGPQGPDVAPQQAQPMHQPRSFDGPQRYDNRPQHQQRRDQQRGDHPRQHNNQPRHDRNDNRNDNRNENRFDRGDRAERQDRQDRPDRQDNRSDRQDRPERSEFRGDRPDRGDRPERFDRPDRPANGNSEPRVVREERAPLPPLPPLPPVSEPMAELPVAPPRLRRERFQATPVEQPQPVVPAVPQSHQPEFLRRPVRRPRAEPPAEEAAPPRQPAREDQE